MWKFVRYSERKNRKSLFSTTPLSFDAPPQGTPTNICINIILPETTFPVLHFCRWQYMGSSGNFLTVLKNFISPNANPSGAKPETNLNAKWSFKVIYLGIIEEPLRGYIAQYNKRGLKCEGSEDIVSEWSENCHFRPPLSHLTPPLQRTPTNICIKLTLLETSIPGLHFCRW